MNELEKAWGPVAKISRDKDQSMMVLKGSAGEIRVWAQGSAYRFPRSVSEYAQEASELYKDAQKVFETLKRYYKGTKVQIEITAAPSAANGIAMIGPTPGGVALSFGQWTIHCEPKEHDTQAYEVLLKCAAREGFRITH